LLVEKRRNLASLRRRFEIIAGLRRLSYIASKLRIRGGFHDWLVITQPGHKG